MKRNKFSLSNYKLVTGDMGKLIPINCIEVLPGDSIQQATSLLLRMSPLLAPVMHPVTVRIHNWFVPTRQVWESFEQFITGGPGNNDATVPPYSNLAVEQGSLSDYLGLPTMPEGGRYSVLPHRAYHLIANEYYRDQDLQQLPNMPLTEGFDDNDYITELRSVCWEKDYFTSSRPWTQKGDEVSIGLGDEAEVTGTITDPARDLQVRDGAGGTGNNPALNANGGHLTLDPAGADSARYIHHPAGSITHDLIADISNATSVTISQLREAFALQRYAEARAKYGSRYTEYLRYLGVNSSDARLNRPEYLGGGKQTIQFSEVLQTAGDSTGDPTGVGNIAGHGLAAMRSNRYRRFFEEHGYVLSLMSVVPKTVYAQGISKMWDRRQKEDYYQKELEGIGQAEVLNKEILATHTTPEGVFGYQDRYDEYRRQESMIHGEFRNELDHWHLARIFAGDVTLNGDFVTCDPSKRIHAVQNQHTMWVMVKNSVQARRMIGRK